jgi:hypothetical protein
MKCHQRIIREKISQDPSGELFHFWKDLDVSINKAELMPISHATASAIIRQYEYLGTMSNAPIASFGIYWGGFCGGVVVFGSPSPPSIASSVIPKEYASKVIQLGRGASVHWAHEHASSKLIGYGLKEIEKLGYRVVFAFADPMAGEIGTVYQATNWLYCGWTEKRPDYIDGYGKVIVGPVGVIKGHMTIKPRPRKRRYVHILGDRREKRNFRAMLKWPVFPYEKRVSLPHPAS